AELRQRIARRERAVEHAGSHAELRARLADLAHRRGLEARAVRGAEGDRVVDVPQRAYLVGDVVVAAIDVAAAVQLVLDRRDVVVAYGQRGLEVVGER